MKSVMNDEEQKKRHIQNQTDDVSPHLPEELVLENIATRLSARDLSGLITVSKLWYNSIENDRGFAMSHFVNHENNKNLCFNLHNVTYETDHPNMIRSYFFNLEKDSDNSHFYDFELSSVLGSAGSVEPVGNCNGLSCVKRPSADGFEEIFITNPVRGETLIFTCLTPEIGGVGGSLEYLCHGFGFDSSSQEYKVVVTYTTSTADNGQGFICMVVTLGATSWRKIVISTSEISPPPGCSPFPSQMVTRMWKDTHRSATICAGDLLWRITNTANDGYKTEMLLLFDIHNEKIQFLQLPTECTSLVPTMNENDCLEIGHHLLEFKGYPCVARSEKIMITERVIPDNEYTEFHYFRFKVHLYILKDRFQQIWVEDETFDVRMKEERKYEFQDPFSRYFDFSFGNNISTHPTCILGFSDQVILYWFDGGCLIFYNLLMKHYNVVKGNRSCIEQNRDIFEAKMVGITPDTEPEIDGYDIDILFPVDGYGDIHCPCIDYQLHAQVENIISLKTFIPEGGEVGEFDCYNEFQQFVTDTGRKTAIWYVLM
ncbi:uncharacterized protein LOC113272179 [Papaver somniferum]|uniref:uncharacterized protein LOC113272179 n=1 Tax=Papaver somniferum TaxID=3469 RepID=UPI000E6F846C|nr:uncharacterized protein LOC113272179 [Papaver somniferum]